MIFSFFILCFGEGGGGGRSRLLVEFELVFCILYFGGGGGGGRSRLLLEVEQRQARAPLEHHHRQPPAEMPGFGPRQRLGPAQLLPCSLFPTFDTFVDGNIYLVVDVYF